MTRLSSLNRKLLRDLWHMRGQVFAIGVVMACGVATMVMAFGLLHSLSVTRAAYYDRQAFAHVFASLNRAPRTLMAHISEIPGVAGADARVVETSIMDVPGAERPAIGRLVSLPRAGEAGLNRIILRWGRLPHPGRTDEVVVNEAFGDAHTLKPDARISINLNGKRRSVLVVGFALSPEYVYAIGPGQTIPDDTSFGVVWMDLDAMEAAFDFEGAFNDLSVRLLRGTNEAAVIARIDHLLKPYGGLGAIGRNDHPSDVFLDSELEQLDLMGWVIPPIFLGVAAFLLNIVIGRLLDTEREQIGLIKAFGYSDRDIGWHYLKMVLAIACLGAAGGVGLGAWMGHGVAGLYTKVFHFPYLHYELNLPVIAFAVGVSLLTAALGAWNGLRKAMALSPAVAMRPPPPPVYRRSFTEMVGLSALFSPAVRMIVRHIERWPVRAGITVMGVGASVGLIVSTLFMFDSIERIIAVYYFEAQRQDVLLTFTEEVAPEALFEAQRLPGVLRAEGFRAAPVKMTHLAREERVAIVGISGEDRLVRLLDKDLQVLDLPPEGLAMSASLARKLGVGVGDELQIEALDGLRKTGTLTVAKLIEEYVGQSIYMDKAALERFVGGPHSISGARLSVDPAQSRALFKKVTDVPHVAGAASRRAAVDSFRSTIAESMGVALLFYVGFAAAITIGVIYNAARISLSERARDLATLRVLGFTRWETAFILLGEFLLLTLFALPVGCVAGYGFAAYMTVSFATDFIRIPLVVSPATYMWSVLAGLGAAAVSAWAVGRRIAALDLVAVLKTRD